MLDDKVKVPLEKAATEIMEIMEKYFPDITKLRDEFHQRVWMTLYIELIHAGYFNDK